MIKSCVIGLSRIGIIHCQSLIKLKKTQLSFVYDCDDKLRNKFAKKFNCKTSSRFEDILNQKDIELFVIASPTITHKSYINKLINKNKMIYCEKPIFLNAQKIKIFSQKIVNKKIKFGVGLNRRFANPYIKLKKLVHNKKINVIKITSKSLNTNVKKSISNGGLFMDKGFHFFDLACWLLSSKPYEVECEARSISNKIYLKNNDFSKAIIKMKFNKNICVKFYFSRVNKLGHEENITIIGDDFSINSDNFFKKDILYEDYDIKFQDTYYECLKNFVTNNKSYLLEEGINAQLICDAVLKSANLEKKITLSF